MRGSFGANSGVCWRGPVGRVPILGGSFCEILKVNCKGFTYDVI